MQTYTHCLSRSPVAKIIFLKLFRILFCFFLWLVEIYEQKDMLVLIRETPPTTTAKILRRRQGTVSNILRHKRGHRCRQQRKIHKGETLTALTLKTMLLYQQQKRLRDADGDNGNIWQNINMIFQSYRFEKWQQIMKFCKNLIKIYLFLNISGHVFIKNSKKK